MDAVRSSSCLRGYTTIIQTIAKNSHLLLPLAAIRLTTVRAEEGRGWNSARSSSFRARRARPRPSLHLRAGGRGGTLGDGISDMACATTPASLLSRRNMLLTAGGAVAAAAVAAVDARSAQTGTAAPGDPLFRA